MVSRVKGLLLYPRLGSLNNPEHEENDITPSDIKAAQGIAGELLWLWVRSRPAISFSVGQICRQVSHHPTWALQVGRGVLEYLASTPNHGLV